MRVYSSHAGVFRPGCFCLHSTCNIYFVNLSNYDLCIICVMQGLLYLDSVLSVIRKRSWQNSTLEEELKQWLSLLLSLVDISSANVESYLKDFLTTKSGGVTKLFREHIKREVCFACM